MGEKAVNSCCWVKAEVFTNVWVLNSQGWGGEIE